MRNEYRMMLSDYRWKNFRERVFNYHKKQCKCCNSDKGLQVHHLFYEKNKKPWEYDVETVVPLCADCHRKIHGGELDVKYEGGEVEIMPKGYFDILNEVFSLNVKMRQNMVNGEELCKSSCSGKTGAYGLEYTNFKFPSRVMVLFKSSFEMWEETSNTSIDTLEWFLCALWDTKNSRMFADRDIDEYSEVLNEMMGLDDLYLILYSVGCYAYLYDEKKVAWNIFHMANNIKKWYL